MEPKPTGSVGTLGEGANFNAKSLIAHNEIQAHPPLRRRSAKFCNTVHVYVHKLDFHVVAAISMNGTGSRSNSLEADVGHASATREGGEGAERDHSSRRRHQTTLAVISLDTTPGNTDVEDGGGADQVRTQLE